MKNECPALPDFGMSKVLVLGDMMLDRYVWGDVSRVSPEAPVPVVRILSRTHILGGAGNVVANLAGLGCNVVCLGVVGDDPEGDIFKELLSGLKVDSHLFVSKERPTTSKSRIMGRGQQLMRLDEEETGPLCSDGREFLKQTLKEQLDSVSAVILSDYGKGVFAGDLALFVTAFCAASGIPVFVDPKGADWEKYHGATCITPNTKEFLEVVRFDPAVDKELEARSQDVISEFGLKSLLVTRGAQGMSLSRLGGETVHIPTQAREVYDVSGAGDTVISTLAAAVGAGLSLEDAARLSNVAAGIVVGKVGTRPIRLEELSSALLKASSGADHKIRSREEAAAITDGWRKDGQRVVFTNGCFDLMHVGHIKVLHSSAEQGNRLVVGLNSDSSVRRLKGDSRPVIPEHERAALMAALECVDLVVLFDEDTPLELIRALKPDVLVKGGDYSVETVVGHDEVAKWGGQVAIVPLLDGKSTTALIDRLKKA